MKPTPWTTEAAEPAEKRAAEALAAARVEPEPWSPAKEREVLAAVRARVEERPSLAGRLVLFAAVAGASAAAVFFASRLVSSTPPAPPQLLASADADYTVTPSAPSQPVALSVHRGSVHVKRDASGVYTLDAPGLSGRVEARVFDVQVAGARAELVVEEGSADVVTRDGRTLHIAAGQRIASDDPRLQPPTPAPQPQPQPQHASTRSPSADLCAAITDLASRRACYVRVAQGDDLAAQNAMMELGMLEQDEAHDGASALEYWSAYQKRFPAGALGPEASVAILGELLSEQKLVEARKEAESFMAKYPQDGRVGELRITRASLGCQLRGASGLSELDALEGVAGVDLPSLRLEQGKCEARLGRHDEAREHWLDAVQRDPNGPHVDELRRLLGE
ncbi:MAG: hypothetical protein JST54_16820 [Deltaproteobacteria bacterium]|nr:hypothetical protein [Deltaproteobacteria bacterium]